MGMTLTISKVCQLVNYRHILINGHIINISNYSCISWDTITVMDEEKSRALIEIFFYSSTHEKLLNHLTLYTF